MDVLTRQLLHLNLIVGVGPACIQRILTTHHSPHSLNVYEWTVEKFAAVGIGVTKAQEIIKGLKDTTLLHKELDLLRTQDIAVVSLYDPLYSALLKEIYLPPFIIYCQGNTQLLNAPSIAVVGSRAADEYAKRVVQRLLPPLLEQGLTIVSGGALGVDTLAHLQAVNAKGSTIVVLGSGLLQPYPAQNKKLFTTIVEQGGLVLSSFSLQAPPAAGNFPARNRIIAGLSKGCLVVQAGEKSGARITANFALEQGREVFAVPGPIDNPLSLGCHALLAQGATLVSKSEDILVQFDPTWQGSSRPLKQPLEVQEDSKTIFVEPSPVSSPILAEKSTAHQLLSLCAQPASFDSLLASLPLTAEELHNVLFTYQLEGVVEQTIAGLWKMV